MEFKSIIIDEVIAREAFTLKLVPYKDMSMTSVLGLPSKWQVLEKNDEKLWEDLLEAGQAARNVKAETAPHRISAWSR
uniref:Uncharacterized protein n=1 Tax=Ditylenchus dipsaci TaxID=166011 RepID=A0A915CSW5_9BILA